MPPHLVILRFVNYNMNIKAFFCFSFIQFFYVYHIQKGKVNLKKNINRLKCLIYININKISNSFKIIDSSLITATPINSICTVFKLLQYSCLLCAYYV